MSITLEKKIINWVPQSTNPKTGNVPQAYIGNSLEGCKSSCRNSGCKLFQYDYLSKKIKEATKKELELNYLCYAWQGAVKLSLYQILNTKERLKDILAVTLEKQDSGEKLTIKEKNKMKEAQERYSLDYALKNRHVRAKAVRLSAIGDPGVVSYQEATQLKIKTQKEGIGILGYTHSWKQGHAEKIWKGWLLASCDNMQEADLALDKGWRVSVVLPHKFVGQGKKQNIFTTPKGRKGIVCPAMVTKGLVDCNTCLLCVGQKTGPVIGFPNHK